MNESIVYPFGWLAGKEGKTSDVIADLAIEMLGHRSNLLERAQHLPNTMDYDRAKETLEMRAEDIEKYAVILNIIYVQMRPEVWSANATGLIDLAVKHDITLPDWMKQVKP